MCVCVCFLPFFYCGLTLPPCARLRRPQTGMRRTALRFPFAVSWHDAPSKEKEEEQFLRSFHFLFSVFLSHFFLSVCVRVCVCVRSALVFSAVVLQKRIAPAAALDGEPYTASAVADGCPSSASFRFVPSPSSPLFLKPLFPAALLRHSLAHVNLVLLLAGLVAGDFGVPAVDGELLHLLRDGRRGERARLLRENHSGLRHQRRMEEGG